MEASHSEVWADYFKQKFPACHKCQNGSEAEATMLLHLTVSHYKEEAVKAFGGGITCQMCDERLAPHKECYTQYYVLSHMVRHLEQFVPVETKSIFWTAMEMNQDKERKAKIVPKNDHKASSMSDSTQIKSEDCTEAKNEIRNKSDKKVKSSTTLNNKEELVKHQFGKVTTGKAKAKSSLKMSDSHWQDCQEHFKQKYPSCPACTMGHKEVWRMRRHLTFVHYGDIAMELFGKGQVCSICNKVSIEFDSRKSRLKRHNLIKCHMATHLEQFIPDEHDRSFFARAKAKD